MLSLCKTDFAIILEELLKQRVSSVEAAEILLLNREPIET